MSAKELYRVFACSHLLPVDCHHKDWVVVQEMECPREKDRCSGCGSGDVIRRGSRQLEVVSLAPALQTTNLLICVPRLECRNCCRVPQAATPNVVAGCHTPAFAQLVVSLRPMMTNKCLRWLLLKHSDNLDPERNEALRLREALEPNRSVHVGYYLKDDLSQIWNQGSKASDAIFLDDWCRRARATGIRVLQTMANTLQGHWTEI
jgi:hypothetical protein